MREGASFFFLFSQLVEFKEKGKHKERTLLWHVKTLKWEAVRFKRSHSFLLAFVYPCFASSYSSSFSVVYDNPND